MARTVAIGVQDFAKLREKEYFYVDKTAFINVWWESFLTNLEVKRMFVRMIKGWFEPNSAFNEFVAAMFKGDVRSMNHYLNKAALATFSYFGAGNHPSGQKPERFYHGFVLGLLVDNAKHYMVKSNRESGFGRYDAALIEGGIPKERIFKYGLAFEGKRCLIQKL